MNLIFILGISLEHMRHSGSRPSMRDLNKYVIPSVATKWYDVGLELLETKYEKELDIIETNCNDVKICCRKMFSKWLQTEELASWNKLIEALRNVELNNVVTDIEQLLHEPRKQEGDMLRQLLVIGINNQF